MFILSLNKRPFRNAKYLMHGIADTKIFSSSLDTIFAHAIPNREALMRFSDGAVGTNVCKHT